MFREPSKSEAWKINARKYWYSLVAGAGLVATGTTVEITSYRPDLYGIVSLVGGVACMVSTWPIEKLDRANEMVETYREIRNLPETNDFTGAE